MGRLKGGGGGAVDIFIHFEGGVLGAHSYPLHLGYPKYLRFLFYFVRFLPVTLNFYSSGKIIRRPSPAQNELIYDSRVTPI